MNSSASLWIHVANIEKVELTVYFDFVCVPVWSPWTMCNIPPQLPLRAETIHNFVFLSLCLTNFAVKKNGFQ